MLENLLGQFSEAPVAMGLAIGGAVLEVLASPDGGTFTVIITSPEGITCLIAAGTGWEILPVLKGQGL